MQSFMMKVSRIGQPEPSMKMGAPATAVEYWASVISKREWFDAEKEQLVVLLLNTRYDVLAFQLVSLGTINESIAHPREIFRPAIAAGAYAIIVMHNHPSGDPSPSPADHSITHRLREAGELLQIKVLDHVVIGAGATPHFSFKEAGVL